MRHQAEQWPMFTRVLQQAQRMDAMMERLGVDRALAARKDEGRAFAQARLACLHCLSASQCEWWLAHVEGAPEPPAFCPLAAFFATGQHHLAS